MATVKEVEALLPQTQCGECGFSGCLPYAEALVQGLAPINQCPPGGVETLQALGALLGTDASPYVEGLLKNTREPSVAVIREADCIGCTKCIQACPVDAIIGSAKRMHALITQECTGCGLCVEPCPVDCIEMVNLPEPQYNKETARQRFHNKQSRLLREEHEQQQAYREKRSLEKHSLDKKMDIKAKQDYIEQALARVNAKRSV